MRRRFVSSLPYLLFLLSFASFQLYSLSVGFLDTYETFFAYIVFYLFLLVLFLIFTKLVEGSKLGQSGFIVYTRKLASTFLLSGVFVAVYYLVTLEPGATAGFSLLQRLSPFTVGYFLVTAPLITIVEEAVYRGYILRRLSNTGSFTRGLFVSSILYALQLTSLPTLVSLGNGSAIQYFFTNTLTGMILGIVMGLYFCRSSWSLVGPVLFRTGLVLQTNLGPLTARAPAWEYSFVFQMVAYAILLVMIGGLVSPPKFIAIRYLEARVSTKGRVTDRIRGRLALRKTLIGIAVITVLAITLGYGLTGISHSTPLRAIATGSMQPTLQVGDLVLVSPLASSSDVHVGDIIVYTGFNLNGPIIHRVTNIQYDARGSLMFTTKGDDNTSPDPLLVSYSQVQGKIWYHLPLLGYLILLWPMTLGLVLILALVPTLRSAGNNRRTRRAR